MCLELVVHEHAVAKTLRLALKGKRDEAAEPARGDRVLRGVEAVVGIKVPDQTVVHGSRDEEAAKVPRERGGQRLVKEHPCVRPVPRPRALKGHVHPNGPACMNICERLPLPACAVEVGGEE